MNKTDKVILLFYAFLAVSYISTIIYIDGSFSDLKLTIEGKKTVDEIELVKTVSIGRAKIFDTMTDVQNYPIILPKNVISVKILNQSDNVIYAEEEVVEKYIKTKLIVKHTTFPYYNHTLEVMNGDAQGTKITQTFDGNDSETTFNTKIKLHLKGILAPFAYFPDYVLGNELNHAILDFVDYAKGFDDDTKKTVDDLYREILLRPADKEGFEYWGSLLESGKITKEEMRQAILNSDEYGTKFRYDPNCVLYSKVC